MSQPLGSGLQTMGAPQPRCQAGDTAAATIPQPQPRPHPPTAYVAPSLDRTAASHCSAQGSTDAGSDRSRQITTTADVTCGRHAARGRRQASHLCAGAAPAVDPGSSAF